MRVIRKICSSYEAMKKSKSTGSFSKRLRFYSLQQLASYILSQKDVFDFVECGCWKGHSSYMISKLIAESNKKVNLHIFDSFEGLSNATKNDESFYLRNEKEKKKFTNIIHVPKHL